VKKKQARLQYLGRRAIQNHAASKNAPNDSMKGKGVFQGRSTEARPEPSSSLAWPEKPGEAARGNLPKPSARRSATIYFFLNFLDIVDLYSTNQS
jgi:hypothetical protein